MRVHASISAFVLYWLDLRDTVFSLMHFVIDTLCVGSPLRIAHCVDGGVSSMTELADWATTAASRVTADTDGSIIRQVFDELDGARQPESAWFAGLVTTLHEQNSATRGQIMEQLAN